MKLENDTEERFFTTEEVQKLLKPDNRLWTLIEVKGKWVKKYIKGYIKKASELEG